MAFKRDTAPRIVSCPETITEKALIGDWDCCMALLDMSRAFDTVYRDKLMDVLQEALGSEKTKAIMLLFT